jgi:hypothetical protein
MRRRPGAAALLGAGVLCVLLASRSKPTSGRSELVALNHVDYQMPPSLDKQDCIKAGATCTIRVAGGYLKLTDIQFPAGQSEAGSAEADGVIKGKHVHGKVTLQGNQLPLGHFVPARDDPEPYIAARRAREEQEGDSDGEKAEVPHEDDDALPGNASSVLRFSAKYGGHVIKRSRADLRRGGGLDSQYSKAVRTIVGNLKRQHEKVDIAEDQIANAVESVITSHAVSSSIASLALKVADERAMQADGNTFLEPKAQQLAEQKAGGAAGAKTRGTVLPQLQAAASVSAAAAALEGGGGVMAAVGQALAGKQDAAAFEPGELVYDRAAKPELPGSYPESGFPEQVVCLCVYV